MRLAHDDMTRGGLDVLLRATYALYAFGASVATMLLLGLWWAL